MGQKHPCLAVGVFPNAPQYCRDTPTDFTPCLGKSLPSKTQRTAAWYDKPSPTFVDAIALVRRHLWLASEGFSLSVADPDVRELTTTLYHRMVDSLAYAA